MSTSENARRSTSPGQRSSSTSSKPGRSKERVHGPKSGLDQVGRRCQVLGGPARTEWLWPTVNDRYHRAAPGPLDERSQKGLGDEGQIAGQHKRSVVRTAIQIIRDSIATEVGPSDSFAGTAYNHTTSPKREESLIRKLPDTAGSRSDRSTIPSCDLRVAPLRCIGTSS